jgi:hypothetical protein
MDRQEEMGVGVGWRRLPKDKKRLKNDQKDVISNGTVCYSRMIQT